jgi:hypothetical protein
MSRAVSYLRSLVCQRVGLNLLSNVISIPGLGETLVLMVPRSVMSLALTQKAIHYAVYDMLQSPLFKRTVLQYVYAHPLRFSQIRSLNYRYKHTVDDRYGMRVLHPNYRYSGADVKLFISALLSLFLFVGVLTRQSVVEVIPQVLGRITFPVFSGQVALRYGLPYYHDYRRRCELKHFLERLQLNRALIHVCENTEGPFPFVIEPKRHQADTRGFVRSCLFSSGLGVILLLANFYTDSVNRNMREWHQKMNCHTLSLLFAMCFRYFLLGSVVNTVVTAVTRLFSVWQYEYGCLPSEYLDQSLPRKRLSHSRILRF